MILVASFKTLAGNPLTRKLYIPGLAPAPEQTPAGMLSSLLFEAAALATRAAQQMTSRKASMVANELPI
jgi:hypothetical protein